MKSGGTKRVVFDLLGNPTPPRGVAATALRINRYRGKDSAGWTMNAPTFSKVTFPDAFPNVACTLNSTKTREFEFRYLLAPHADVSAVVFSVYEAHARLSREGRMILHHGEDVIVTLATPKAFQVIDGRKIDVAVEYVPLAANRFGFALAPFDCGHPLTIDPVAVAPVSSTFVGAAGNERLEKVAVNSSGEIFVIGKTDTAPFASPNATHDATFAPGLFDDVVVGKYSSAGVAQWFTYFGDARTDQGHDIEIASSGDVIVVGETTHGLSPSVLPTIPSNLVTPSPADGSPVDDRDAFVGALDPSDGSLKLLSSLGGLGDDVALGLALDAQDRMLITGFTTSPNLGFQANSELSSWSAGPANNPDVFVLGLTWFQIPSAPDLLNLDFFGYYGSMTDVNNLNPRI